MGTRHNHDDDDDDNDTNHNNNDNNNEDEETKANEPIGSKGMKKGKRRSGWAS